MRVLRVWRAICAVSVVAAATGLVVVPGGTPEARAAEPGLSHSVVFRTSLGLSTDAGHIRRVEDARRAGSPDVTDELGVPLTTAEFAEVDFRQQVISDDAPTIRARVSADILGGVFMDNRNGGMLTVAVTRDAQAVAARLRPLLRHPSRLRVVAAERTLASLESTKDAIFEGRGSLLPEIDVTKASLDLPLNIVRIGVAGDPATAQDYFDRHYGRGLVVVSQESVAPAGTTAVDSPPFKGGQSISGSNGYTCTSGFVAYRATTPVTYYVLSAAHCGPVGAAWTQGGVVPMGQTDRVDNSIADTLRIPIAATTKSNLVTINYSSYLGQGTYRSITSSQGAAADVVGETECSSGRNTTSLQCGPLLATSVDYDWTTSYGAYASFRYGREADFDCNPGDSGGSVLYGGQARGIMSAKVTRTFGNDTCIYGHIYDNIRGTGVTGVVTTP
jgi:hypothetical protein